MIFECEMITKVTVRIKADDEIQARDYISTHTFEDIREATSDYIIEYEDKIVNYGQECDDEGYAIDITEETD